MDSFRFFSEDNTFNFLKKVNFFRVHFWNVGTSFSLNSILSKKFKSLIKANDNSWGAGMEKSRLKNSSFVWNIFIKRLNSLPLEEKTLTRPCPRKKSLADNQRLTKDFIKILWNEKIFLSFLLDFWLQNVENIYIFYCIHDGLELSF